MELVGKMVSELEAGNAASFPKQRPIEEEVWEFLRARNASGSMGRRVCMARYGAPLAAAQKMKPWWSVKLWEQTHACLEGGYMKGKAVEFNKAKISHADAANATGGSTSVAGLKVEDKCIRGAANAMVISQLTLQSPQHQRIVSILTTLGEGLSDHHTEQNKVCRSVPECKECLVKLVSGGYTAHLRQIVSLLTSPAHLAAAGFKVPKASTGMHVDSAFRLENCVNDEVIIEDEYANTLGLGALMLLVARYMRGAWLYGWPAKMYTLLGSGPVKTVATLQLWKKDQEIFVELKAQSHTSDQLKRMEKLHVFQQTANLQYALAINDIGIDDLPDNAAFLTLVKERAEVIIAAQAVEDIKGVQAVSSPPPCRKHRRLATCMAHVLEQGVLTKKHRFKAVEVASPAYLTSSTLPASAWEPSVKEASMDFNGVQSTKAHPDWYSPCAARMNTPHADLAVLRDVSRLGDLDLASNTWLGEAFDASHMMVVGLPKAVGVGVQCYIPIMNFPKSGVMLWPVTKQVLDGQTCLHFDPTDEPVVRPVLNLINIKAQCFEWKSWLWRCTLLQPGNIAYWSSGIRAFTIGNTEDTFAQCCCKNAWFQMSPTEVREYAKYYQVPIAPGATTFDVLWSFLAAKCPELSDQQRLACLHKRKVGSTENTGASDVLLAMDEAAEVLEQQDEKTLKAEQVRITSARGIVAEFSTQYTAKAVTVRAAAEAKTKGKKKPAVPAAQRPPPGPHHIEQGEARDFCPPCAHIWRSLLRGEWCGHVLLCKRVSASFHAYGSSEAALNECLKKMWRQWLEQNGMALSECPIAGHF